MKKIFLVLFFGIFLLPFINATINFEKEPLSVYNLGDNIKTSLKIDSSSDINANVDLVCENKRLSIYKEFLSGNLVISKEVIVPLKTNYIGDLLGNCYFEVFIDGESEALSNNFKISNKLIIDFSNETWVLNPQEKWEFSGTAIKENLNSANGDVEIRFLDKLVKGKISDGKFFISYEFSKDVPAGEHSVIVKIIDFTQNEKNIGEKNFKIRINQIPTNLETLINKNSFNPGEKISGKVLLYDQTGKEMTRNSYILIKNGNGNSVAKIEGKTGETFEYNIPKNERPNLFNILVYSENIVAKIDFKINEFQKIETEILNQTLIVKNKGNILYNGTIKINIGEDIVDLLILINPEETQKFTLTAPDGEYSIKVGETEKIISLTGKAIEVKKLEETKFSVNPLVWTFLILILGLSAFFTFRKAKKKSSFTKPKKKFKVVKSKIQQTTFNENLPKRDLVYPRKKLELSLSITGNRQDASLICLSFKNYSLIKSGQGNVSETIEKIKNITEENKGLIYNNDQSIFFVFAPTLTKTFKNENTAILVSKKIVEILNDHNKKFKNVINFGLSVGKGAIILKEESGAFKFMSLGNLLSGAKKIANFSQKEILLSEKFKSDFGEKINFEPVEIGNLKAYKFKDYLVKKDNSTFIKGFLSRMERDKVNLTSQTKQED